MSKITKRNNHTTITQGRENLNPIAKSFMKFCEEKMGVTFIDVTPKYKKVTPRSKK